MGPVIHRSEAGYSYTYSLESYCSGNKFAVETLLFLFIFEEY